MKAAKRLKSSKRKSKILQVPQNNMDLAAEVMRKAGISGTIINISGTKKRRIHKK
jgi:3-oxoacyl-(acyl-carrier-protein) synthase